MVWRLTATKIQFLHHNVPLQLDTLSFPYVTQAGDPEQAAAGRYFAQFESSDFIVGASHHPLLLGMVWTMVASTSTPLMPESSFFGAVEAERRRNILRGVSVGIDYFAIHFLIDFC